MHTEILPQNVATIVLDAEGLFFGMNSAAEQLLGENVIDFINNWLPIEENTVIDFTDRSIRVDMLKTDQATYLLLFDDHSHSPAEKPGERHQHHDFKASATMNPKHAQDLMTVKAKSTAMIAHQFGTPISAVRLKSYLLKKHLGSLSKERITEHLEQIETQLDQMVDLLDDLLLVNQVYSAEQVASFSPLDLEAFSRKIVEPMMLDWSERDIRLSFSGEMRNVQLDRRLIRYVLSNLLGGILKNSGSAVQIDVLRVENTITLAVNARDIILPTHQLARILAQMAHPNGTSALSGTGLSLSVIKTCVEMYGGAISVESKPSQGTTFLVSLPCRDA